MPEYLQDLAASFRRDLRAEGKAARTILIYTTAIEQYCAWLSEQGRPTTVDEFTRSGIRAWLAQLTETKAPATVSTRFRALRRFCSWLVAEEIREDNPMRGMQDPHIPEKPVPVLTDSELGKLLKTCSGRGFYARRDEAVFRLLFDCGLRAAELCGIKMTDVDLDADSIKVTGKGNKVRHVYPSAKTVRALDRYIRERARHKQSPSPALFLSQKGPLSVNGLRDICDKRGKQAGIQHVHPHMFRHVFAADFLVSGGQERDLMRLAGWKSTSMLARYGSATADARAKEAARRLNRGDRV